LKSIFGDDLMKINALEEKLAKDKKVKVLPEVLPKLKAAGKFKAAGKSSKLKHAGKTPAGPAGKAAGPAVKPAGPAAKPAAKAAMKKTPQPVKAAVKPKK